MTKYLIVYECAHWCGGESHVVVNAASEHLAIEKASPHMHEGMYALFNEEYLDCIQQGTYEDGETTFTVNDIQEFDPSHEYWKFYKDPTQRVFFPEIF